MERGVRGVRDKIRDNTARGYIQVSEPCQEEPVNGVAQRAGVWRTGAPLFRSAPNRSFPAVANVGGEG